MALYNNGFPATYQQYFPQYQSPYQIPQYQQINQQQNAQQTMTPPIVHADIIQVSSEAEAENYPVAAGASQMMIAKDESAIYVKSAFSNGQSNFDVFPKRPQKPPVKPVDMTAYVTWDKLEERLSAIETQTKRPSKKETEAEA